MAIINYINGEGPSLLLKAIRQNRVEEILEQFHQKSKEIKVNIQMNTKQQLKPL